MPTIEIACHWQFRIGSDRHALSPPPATESASFGAQSLAHSS
jgi:hypothetical protein